MTYGANSRVLNGVYLNGLIIEIFVFSLLITQTLKKNLKGHLKMLHNILINFKKQSLERCFSMIALPEDPGSVFSSHSK